MVPTIPSRTLVIEVFNQINGIPVYTIRTGPITGYYLESPLPERTVKKNSIETFRNKD